MKRWLSFTVLFSVLLAACQTSTPSPTPTPTPSPADYLNMAAAAMADIQSVQFSLTREGAPVVLDPTMGVQFVSASGAYESPDRVHASVKADFAGNILAIEMLWLPEGNYISNPLTGAYEPLPESVPLDPVAMFDQELGLSKLLAENLQEPTLIGMETIEGVDTRHLRGTASAEALVALVPNAPSVDLTVDVWLDVTTSRVIRIEVIEETGDKTTVDFFEYDAPVTIPNPN